MKATAFILPFLALAQDSSVDSSSSLSTATSSAAEATFTPPTVPGSGKCFKKNRPVAAPAPAPAPQAQPAPSANVRVDCLGVLNQRRSTEGTAPLQWDNTLAQQCQTEANYCASYQQQHKYTFGHAQVIFKSKTSCSSSISAWWDDEKAGRGWGGQRGHYYNIRNPAFSRVGCAVALQSTGCACCNFS
ncbi:hypothetical protein HDV03_004671 [Kappamyces sp. JEL0829]|nr:hypothetical protein HDV03_004671 [Kappamyces sp. JEL0829]